MRMPFETHGRFRDALRAFRAAQGQKDNVHPLFLRAGPADLARILQAQRPDVVAGERMRHSIIPFSVSLSSAGRSFISRTIASTRSPPASRGSLATCLLLAARAGSA